MGNNDLAKLINDAVAERLTAEAIREEVGTRVDKLIKDSIDSELQSFSGTGKIIKEAVAESIKISHLDLPAYGETVMGILKNQIEATVAEVVGGRLSEDMAEILSLAPKTAKLSKIVEGMVKYHEDEPDKYHHDIVTCIVERSEYGGAHVYLDGDDADVEKYRCDVAMHIDKTGEIIGARFGVSHRGNDRNLKAPASIGHLYGLEQRIRAYYACGTLIELDEDHVVLGQGDY